MNATVKSKIAEAWVHPCITLFVCLLLLMGMAGTVLSADLPDEDRARSAPMGFFWGAALNLRREIYRDYDPDPLALPLIGYRGEKLQVSGPFVNYEMLRQGALSLDVRLSPRLAGYDESDSDTFSGMRDRDISLDLGFGLKWQKLGWKLELAGLRDVLDRSDGSEWLAKLSRFYPVGGVVLEPSIGLSYLDSRHVDYYYGVEANEATGSRPAFRGDSAMNTSLGLSLSTRALFGGLTRIGVESIRYDSSITDSPLTDEDSDLSLFILFSKFFDD